MSEAKPTAAAVNEEQLIASLDDGVKVGEIVRAATGENVEVPREAWAKALAKARPGNDALKKLVAELQAGAASASSKTVVVNRKQALVACQLASV